MSGLARALGIAVVLGLVLGACGKTRQHPGSELTPTEMAGGGGAAGGAVSGAEGGAAGAPAPHCAYPVEGPTFSGSSAEAALELGPGTPIPVAASEWGGLAAAYDVNGDGIDDLVYHAAFEGRSGFRLLVSKIGGAELPITPLDCPELEALPPGRLFLRDVNADEVPDFIIATSDGLVIAQNLPEGFVPVLMFSWPLHWAALELVSGDFDDNGALDLAIAYDRLTGDATGAIGTISFFQGLDGKFMEGTHSEVAFGGGQNDPLLPSGDLAAGRFRSELWELFVPAARGFDLTDGYLGELVSHGDVLQLGDEIHTEMARPGIGWPLRSLAVELGAGLDSLAILSDMQLDIFDLDRDLARPRMALQTVFAHRALTHELGGGDEVPQQWFVDVDRDGDLDFVEASAEGFAVHGNLANQAFATPVTFQGNVSTGAESPFFRVGPITGVIANSITNSPCIHTIFHR